MIFNVVLINKKKTFVFVSCLMFATLIPIIIRSINTGKPFLFLLILKTPKEDVKHNSSFEMEIIAYLVLRLPHSIIKYHFRFASNAHKK